MKLRYVAPLAIAASAAAIGLAPIAAAAASVQQSPGNVQGHRYSRGSLTRRPPKTNSHSAGIRAPCCSTTADHDRALRAEKLLLPP